MGAVQEFSAWIYDSVSLKWQSNWKAFLKIIILDLSVTVPLSLVLSKFACHIFVMCR